MADHLTEYLQEIDRSTIKQKYRVALPTIVKLLYGSGIQVRDIPALRVKDVFDGQGRVRSNMQIKGKPLHISEEVQEILQEYSAQLKRRAISRVGPNSLLFPGYPNEKKIHRHLAKYAYGRSTRIRQEGMAAAAKNESVSEVATRFSRDEMHTRDVLRGRIRYAV